MSYGELGFIPKTQRIYKLALLHKSASETAKDGTLLNYERLEFLGDAVLGAIIAEAVYKYFPKKSEGDLTQLRSRIVSRESLNDIALRMGLDKYVIHKSDISKNKHIYGDVFEAFIGAIYLDQGYSRTKRFINKYILPTYFDLHDLVVNDKNYKSRLIEWVQKNKVEIQIHTVENKHNRKAKFTCTISIEKRVMGKGNGASKKEAEQNSAEKAILKIQQEAEGFVDI